MGVGRGAPTCPADAQGLRHSVESAMWRRKEWGTRSVPWLLRQQRGGAEESGLHTSAGGQVVRGDTRPYLSVGQHSVGTISHSPFNLGTSVLQLARCSFSGLPFPHWFGRGSLTVGQTFAC